MELWDDNSIQFPRLIAELEAAGAFYDAEMVAEACSSMDLTQEQFFELVDRAQAIWDKIKAATGPEGLRAAEVPELQFSKTRARCHYCGWENGCSEDRAAIEAAANEHANTCSQHPQAKLRAAIKRAGFAVMETSGEWSIHDVSEQGKAEEAKCLEVATKNAELEARVDLLETLLTRMLVNHGARNATERTLEDEVRTALGMKL